MTTNSTQRKNSVYNVENGRYVLGGVTEVSVATIEWWSRNQLKRDPTDIVYFFEKKYEGRPDMLGYVFYGDPGLWWLICQYNSILDPETELVEGTVLIIPTKKRINEFKSVVGGVATTRTK